MAKCPTCGAPVHLAPDGDPKFEPSYGGYHKAKPTDERRKVIEELARKVEDNAANLRSQSEQLANWLFNGGDHPTKSKAECRDEAKRLHQVAEGMESAARQIRSPQWLRSQQEDG
jgi:hypothetical protein